jgi:HSP20 family protein
MQGKEGLMDEQLVFAAPPIEAWIDRDKKEYHLSFAVPGVELPNIQLRLQGHNLTVSGDQKSGDGKQQPDYLSNEFFIGPFERTIRLPNSIDVEKLTARYSNGAVEIVAPLKDTGTGQQTQQKSS